jgi:hypothetical protein
MDDAQAAKAAPTADIPLQVLGRHAGLAHNSRG